MKPATSVQLLEEVEKSYFRKTAKFLLFFDVSWWEVVKTDRIGHDIYIETPNEIRKIYLNDQEIIVPNL